MEKIAWLLLGGVVFVAAVRARRSLTAMYVGRAALGVLFIVFGAVVNAIYLATNPDYYESFADSSPFSFVRDTWTTLVVPHVGLFITALIVAEAAAGVLILSGGRRTRLGLMALLGFHAGQLPFGGVLWPWAALMLTALVLLLRAELRVASSFGQPAVQRPESARV